MLPARWKWLCPKNKSLLATRSTRVQKTGPFTLRWMGYELSHFSWSFPTITSLSRGAGPGVDLFFVLSGFLITGILFDSRNDPHRIRNFYVRRTLRIFPLYYAVMLLLIPFAYRGLSWSWLVWPAFLGNYAKVIGPYTSGSPLQRLADFQPCLQVTIHGTYREVLFLGHFWSLCVEEQFYLMWPWIVFWIRD